MELDKTATSRGLKRVAVCALIANLTTGCSWSGEDINNISFHPQEPRQFQEAKVADIPPLVLPAGTKIRTDPWALNGRGGETDNACSELDHAVAIDGFRGYSIFEDSNSSTGYIGIHLVVPPEIAAAEHASLPEPRDPSLACARDKDQIIWIAKASASEQPGHITGGSDEVSPAILGDIKPELFPVDPATISASGR